MLEFDPNTHALIMYIQMIILTLTQLIFKL